MGVLEKSPAEMRGLPKAPVLTAGLASLGFELESSGPAGQVTRTAESVADLEYAIGTHELFKRWCRRWLMLHIGTGIYFGLRWLR